MARGFTALKMNATEELQYVDTYDKVERVMENVQAIRDAVGPHIGIGLDFHGRVHKPMAKVLMRELAPFKLMFIEEPVLSEHLEAIPELAAISPAPIALGERLYSRYDFKRVLEIGGVDISSPIPRMPAASPRRARSPRWPRLMTSRSRCTARSARSHWLRTCSSMRYATTHSSRNRAWASTTTPATTCSTTVSDRSVFSYQDGFVTIPQGPGLGITVNEAT